MRKITLLSILLLASLGISSCKKSKKEVKSTDTINETSKAEVDDTKDIKSSETKLKDFKLEDYVKLKTRADLRKTFGKQNTIDGDTWLAEGTVKVFYTKVTNPENGHNVYFYYNADEVDSINNVELPYKVLNKGGKIVKTQKIYSEKGVYTGMPIKELNKWNDGYEVKFSGFGWDYSGGVYRTKEHLDPKSKLAKSDLSITMSYKTEPKIPNEFLGDVELSSKNDKVLNSEVVIGIISFTLDLEDKMTDDQIQAEKSEDIYFMTMSFEEYFKYFQTAVKNKDKKLFERLSEFGKTTNFSMEEIKKRFNTIFDAEITKVILNSKTADLKDKVIDNEKKKELCANVSYKENGETYESSIFFYFQKTDKGWKLVGIITAG